MEVLRVPSDLVGTDEGDWLLEVKEALEKADPAERMGFAAGFVPTQEELTAQHSMVKQGLDKFLAGRREGPAWIDALDEAYLKCRIRNVKQPATSPAPARQPEEANSFHSNSKFVNWVRSWFLNDDYPMRVSWVLLASILSVSFLFGALIPALDSYSNEGAFGTGIGRIIPFAILALLAPFFMGAPVRLRSFFNVKDTSSYNLISVIAILSSLATFGLLCVSETFPEAIRNTFGGYLFSGIVSAAYFLYYRAIAARTAGLGSTSNGRKNRTTLSPRGERLTSGLGAFAIFTVAIVATCSLSGYFEVVRLWSGLLGKDDAARGFGQTLFVVFFALLPAYFVMESVRSTQVYGEEIDSGYIWKYLCPAYVLSIACFGVAAYFTTPWMAPRETYKNIMATFLPFVVFWVTAQFFEGIASRILGEQYQDKLVSRFRQKK